MEKTEAKVTHRTSELRPKLLLLVLLFLLFARRLFRWCISGRCRLRLTLAFLCLLLVPERDLANSAVNRHRWHNQTIQNQSATSFGPLNNELRIEPAMNQREAEEMQTWNELCPATSEAVQLQQWTSTNLTSTRAKRLNSLYLILPISILLPKNCKYPPQRTRQWLTCVWTWFRQESQKHKTGQRKAVRHWLVKNTKNPRERKDDDGWPTGWSFR